MESRGVRITEIFGSAKTLNKCNRAFVSYATPIFYIHCYVLYSDLKHEPKLKELN